MQQVVTRQESSCDQGCGVDGIPGDYNTDSDPPESSQTPTPTPGSTPTLYGLNKLKVEDITAYTRFSIPLFSMVQDSIY